MNLFDSHAHYNDEKFDNDRKEIIEQTLKNGVSNFIVAGYNIESSKKALNIVKEYKELYSIVGISPNDIEDIKEDKDIDTNILKIEKLIKADDNGKIVAVGEIGLDYYWNKENKELQKIIFKKQIELANKYNLPIVIHTRDAINDTLEIIKNNEVKNRGIFHCCPLNRELVKEALKLGYYISLSGVVTFKNAKNANEIIEMIPENRILIEIQGEQHYSPIQFKCNTHEQAILNFEKRGNKYEIFNRYRWLNFSFFCYFGGTIV